MKKLITYLSELLFDHGADPRFEQPFVDEIEIDPRFEQPFEFTPEAEGINILIGINK